MSVTATVAPATTARFLGWVAVGAGAGLTVLGALSIGVFVAPFVVIGAWLLLRRHGLDAAATGAVCGLGLPLLYVAALNREGPGTVCHVHATYSECSEQWSPWPWLVAALLLIVGGVAAYLTARRTRPPA